MRWHFRHHHNPLSQPISLLSSDLFRLFRLQTSDQTLLDLDKDGSISRVAIAVHQMHKSVTVAQPIQPNTCPSGKIITTNLIIPDSEAYPGQLINHIRNDGELQALGPQVWVTALVGARSDLVFALALMTVVGDFAAFILVGPFNMKFNLYIGLEASGRLVAFGQGNVLCGQYCDGKFERLANDDVGRVVLSISRWAVT